MEIKTNSLGHPNSCRNCNYWGNMMKLKQLSTNKKEFITVIVGTCFKDDNKLEFIYKGEKTSCIMTQASGRCKHFKWRVE